MVKAKREKRWGNSISIDNINFERADPLVFPVVFYALGENKNYSRRVFLIYDGIHYDPLGVINTDGTPIQTVFDSDEDAWIAAAHQLGEEARKV